MRSGAIPCTHNMGIYNLIFYGIESNRFFIANLYRLFNKHRKKLVYLSTRTISAEGPESQRRGHEWNEYHITGNIKCQLVLKCQQLKNNNYNSHINSQNIKMSTTNFIYVNYYVNNNILQIINVNNKYFHVNDVYYLCQ